MVYVRKTHVLVELQYDELHATIFIQVIKKQGINTQGRECLCPKTLVKAPLGQ